MRRFSWAQLALCAAAGIVLVIGGCDESAGPHAGPNLEQTAQTEVASEASVYCTPSTAPTSSSAPEQPSAATRELPHEDIPSSLPLTPPASPRTLAAISDTIEAVFAVGRPPSTLEVPVGGTSANPFVLVLDGREYDTGIVSDGGDITCYAGDIDSDGACEIFLVRPLDMGAELYLFRLQGEELCSALFTYTVPRELTGDGQAEERLNAPCLLFSGVEPIVCLGDSSFAVLTFGTAFERYVFDAATLRVAQEGTLPLDILTGGEIDSIQADVVLETYGAAG